MAQIVCIEKETYNKEINNIGDVVAIHDDDVELTGGGYDGFKIIKVEGMTAKQVQDKLNKNRVETKEEKEKRYWLKDKDWYEIKKSPKYSFCIDVLTKTDLTSLTNKESTDKDTVFSKLKDKISLETTNNETKLV